MAHQRRESCSQRDAHRGRRWVLLAGAWAMVACTLTDDSFEPSPVDRVAGELSPEAPSDASPLPDEAAGPSATPDDSDGTDGEGSDGDDNGDGSEPDLGPLPLDPPGLDPPGSGGGGRPGTGSESGAGQNGGDGGLGPDDGSQNPDVDPAPEPPVTADCPGNEFGGSCYQPFGEYLAWEIAEQRCLAWGGHLASIQSAEEDAFLDDWPAQLGITVADSTGIWLGGTDAAVDGDFRWTDASPLSFTGWAPNQPDNGPGIDCIEKRNDGAALWYDRRCIDSLPFVCERQL